VFAFKKPPAGWSNSGTGRCCETLRNAHFFFEALFLVPSLKEPISARTTVQITQVNRKILHNNELRNLCSSTDVIIVIKSG
jgi:hypothetical protein